MVKNLIFIIVWVYELTELVYPGTPVFTHYTSARGRYSPQRKVIGES